MSTQDFTKPLNLFDVLGRVLQLIPRMPTILKNIKAAKSYTTDSAFR